MVHSDYRSFIINTKLQQFQCGSSIGFTYRDSQVNICGCYEKVIAHKLKFLYTCMHINHPTFLCSCNSCLVMRPINTYMVEPLLKGHLYYKEHLKEGPSTIISTPKGTTPHYKGQCSIGTHLIKMLHQMTESHTWAWVWVILHFLFARIEHVDNLNFGLIHLHKTTPNQ